MAENLIEYLKEHPCKGFRPVPHYSVMGDFVTYYFRDERAYAQRVDDLLTVYLSMETNELVGCKITNVKRILQKAGVFGMRPEGAAKLGLFFFYGAALAKDEAHRKRYEEVARFAKDAELDQSELQTV